ncbi:MAG: leucine-rich repeat domain-containing protein [Clostridia bacterium]|nr:leucine-rich repeat domain-containing protein [Clostridia bacterium]
MTTIGEYSFRSCKLETITIPKNVTSIEEGAFYDCINLKIVVNLSELDIKLGSTDTAISLIPNYGYVAYYAALVVSGDEKYEIIEENNVKYAITNTQVAAMEMIDKNATTCSLRQDTTVIGYNVFGDLLETIKIPASVKIIGNFAFSFCGSLISVEFAENSQLTTIGEHVFESCYLLESIVIPASVTNIEYCTFYDCSALKSVKFDENSQLVRLGSSAFSGCSSLESIKIPAGVSVVGTNTFYNCTSLSSIEFAENSQLVSIKQGAFSNCDLLESIVIPASVTSIERYVFPENDNLTISFENSEGWQYKTSSSATTWNNVTSDIATFIKQNRNYYYRRVE